MFVAYDAEQFLLTGSQFADGLEWWFGLDLWASAWGGFLVISLHRRSVRDCAVASQTPTTVTQRLLHGSRTAFSTMTPVPAISHRDRLSLSPSVTAVRTSTYGGGRQRHAPVDQ